MPLESQGCEGDGLDMLLKSIFNCDFNGCSEYGWGLGGGRGLATEHVLCMQEGRLPGFSAWHLQLKDLKQHVLGKDPFPPIALVKRC